MRKLAILLACVGLSACAAGGGSVATVSAQTITSADALYIAAEKAGSALVIAGTITPDKFHSLDTTAYGVLLQVRAGTATIADLTAVTQLLTVGGIP